MKIRRQKAVAWILVLVFLLEDPAVVRAYGFQDGKPQELSEDKKKYPTDITKTDHLFEYRITYELNGGQNSGKNAESYRMDDLPLTLESPRRVGYNFAGWYADNYFEKKVTTIEQDMVGIWCYMQNGPERSTMSKISAGILIIRMRNLAKTPRH